MTSQPRQLGLLSFAPCSPSGGPFEPLSSRKPSKRASPALPTSSVSVPFPVLSAERPKSSKTDLASSVCLAVVHFGRSAAQILQNGPRQLGLLGCAPCSPSDGPFRPLSSPNPSKRTSPAWFAWLLLGLPLVVRLSLASLVCLAVLLAFPLVVCFGRSAARIIQNVDWVGLGWGKSSKTDVASLVCLAVLLALPLVVRFGRSAAQILQNGPRQLGLLGCAPCSPSGRPFWPLSSPNPSKRTSPIPPLTAGAGRGRTFNLQVKGLALCRLS